MLMPVFCLFFLLKKIIVVLKKYDYGKIMGVLVSFGTWVLKAFYALRMKFAKRVRLSKTNEDVQEMSSSLGAVTCYNLRWYYQYFAMFITVTF